SHGGRTRHPLRRLLLGADAAALRRRRHEPGGDRRADRLRRARKTGAARRQRRPSERRPAARGWCLDARALTVNPPINYPITRLPDYPITRFRLAATGNP